MENNTPPFHLEIKTILEKVPYIKLVTIKGVVLSDFAVGSCGQPGISGEM